MFQLPGHKSNTVQADEHVFAFEIGKFNCRAGLQKILCDPLFSLLYLAFQKTDLLGKPIFPGIRVNLWFEFVPVA